MSLWMVEYVAGARGCPVVLKGELNQPWAWDAFDPRAPESVPDGYVYSSRHPVVDFDHWGAYGMASGRFVDICRGFGLRVTAVPVDVLQSGGTATAKRYSYLLWSEWASIIDAEASAWEAERVYPEGVPAYHKHFPDVSVVGTVERFVVDQAKVPDAAAFRCLDLDSRLVCTDGFKDACESAGLIGLGFVDVSSYTKTDFWD